MAMLRRGAGRDAAGAFVTGDVVVICNINIGATTLAFTGYVKVRFLRVVPIDSVLLRNELQVVILDTGTTYREAT